LVDVSSALSGNNLDVTKTANWIVAQGTTEEVVQVEGSCTWQFLKGVLLRWQLITLKLKEVSTGDSDETRQG
jgi:hypothetical protein